MAIFNSYVKLPEGNPTFPIPSSQNPSPAYLGRRPRLRAVDPNRWPQDIQHPRSSSLKQIEYMGICNLDMYCIYIVSIQFLIFPIFNIPMYFFLKQPKNSIYSRMTIGMEQHDV